MNNAPLQPASPAPTRNHRHELARSHLRRLVAASGVLLAALAAAQPASAWPMCGY